MAGSLNTADRASRSLSDVFTALEHIRLLRERKGNVDKLELDVRASRQKFQAWQKTWSSEEGPLEMSAEALWGGKGWAHISRMLGIMSEIIEKMADHLNELKSTKATNSSRWKRAYKSIQTRHGPSSKMQQLDGLSAELTQVVDELWIYSETVFDSIHGLLSVESSLPERDKLLSTALRSRPSSLKLHHICSTKAVHCSLEMDLLEPGILGSINPTRPFSNSSPVVYRLISLSQGTRKSFQKTTIESVEDPNNLLPEFSAYVQDTDKVQLFKPDTNHSTVLVEVASRGSAQSSHLRIHSKSIETVKLKSSPENLSDILSKLQSADLSTKEHLSVGAKVDLAYKLVECGFFLLGTPWFSSLNSRNLLRLKNTKKNDHSFCLETQSLDLEDLLHDDPSALAETSQLFRLGVLLMEIAVDKPDLHSTSNAADQEEIRIGKLPLVEQSMGIQYCKATAFCLQYGSTRKPFKCNKYSGGEKTILDGSPVWETEKYQEANFDEWQEYLSELLQQYYSQVYTRVKTLRELDSDADYRSVKSWLIPAKDADKAV